MFKKLWLVLLPVLASGILVGKADALDDALARGVLRVSTEPGNYPFTFEDPVTGEPTGITIDIVRMYCEELGIKLEVVWFDWAGVIPALLTGKVDMVAAPLSRTVPRSARILYTDPYIMAPGGAVARKGRFKSLEELNSPGVILTTTAGSIHEEVGRKLFPKAQMMPVPTVADHNAALLAGRADAILTDKYFVGAALVAQYPDLLELLPGYTFMDSFAFAVRYDSWKLWASFNVFLRLIKLDGRYGELYKKWVGIDWEPVYLEHGL
ncbi:MAG: ABC transporter substrate-binding protein [Candidatus Hadarchaeum sp.]|uniref:substrate-binding periplasmic protein n=1 Tax=Candidatus Hadarchaeum sp. TaxID=2883567 RepID=UPI0031700D78